MKALKWIVFSATILLLASGCYFGDEDFFGCVRGNGDLHSEEFYLPQFTGVKLDGIGEVIIRRGDDQRVIVETDRNLLDYIDTDVHNGLWTIDFERCVRRVTRLTVYITLPEVDRVIVSGSGSIVGEDLFFGDELEATLSGSGSIEFEFEGNKVDASIPGSGYIDLFGTTDFMDVYVSGSGDVRAFDMISQECDVFISGSGDVRVYVEEFLKVRISGSGDVLYKGHPDLDIDITGSGAVIDRN
jgi:hypothetical protein